MTRSWSITRCLSAGGSEFDQDRKLSVQLQGGDYYIFFEWPNISLSLLNGDGQASREQPPPPIPPPHPTPHHSLERHCYTQNERETHSNRCSDVPSRNLLSRSTASDMHKGPSLYLGPSYYCFPYWLPEVKPFSF